MSVTPEQLAEWRERNKGRDAEGYMMALLTPNQAMALLDYIEELEDADNCCCGVCGV